VLITDGETRAGVAAARGLAQDGFEVVAAASPAHQPAPVHWSRATARRILTVDPLTDEGGFLDAIEDAVAGGDVGVLIPGSDASLLNVSAGRARLEPHVRIGLPTQAVVQRALDKLELAATTTRHGLAPPPTWTCHGDVEARSAGAQLGYPVIVKPLSSVFMIGGRRHRAGSEIAAGAGELSAILERFGGAALVQQHRAGAVLSFAGVFAGDRLLAEAVSRYRRTWHPDAGSASFSETIEGSPELRERVIGVLVEIGWEGIFELELIESTETATTTWHAIDFNPRPYGSLALAIGAGANLPAIWSRHLLGGEPAPAIAASGVSYRWTDADLRHGLWQLAHGRTAAAADVLARNGRVVHAYGRAADPGPGLARVAELGGAALARVRPRLRARHGGPAIVIGAGPNGLAALAHLRHAGIDARCFGEPLEAWSRQMPEGMLLRSRRRSSHISDPDQALTIDDYERDAGTTVRDPSLTREEFIDYGRWFAQRVTPEVDRRRVGLVSRRGEGFRVTLQDGEEVAASRVIVAAGLGPFQYRPEPFHTLDPWACSHAYDHASLAGFAGRRIAVVGGGQSALESAALLHEHGAEVEVLCRSDSIFWLRDDSIAITRRRGALTIPLPPTDVGGRASGWLAAAPDAFRRLPERVKPTVAFRCIRPAGAGWLRARLQDVPIAYGCQIAAARAADGEVSLTSADGHTRTVDHVLLGTGYRIDVRRYPFLPPELAAELRLIDGYPALGAGLESSVAGLHFLGAPAALSCGPIMRFVVGTWYSAPAVARRAAGRRQPPIAFSFPH